MIVFGQVTGPGGEVRSVSPPRVLVVVSWEFLLLSWVAAVRRTDEGSPCRPSNQRPF